MKEILKNIKNWFLKYKLVAIITVIAIVLLTIGGTLAYFIVQDNSDSYDLIAAGNIDIDFIDGETINSTNRAPLFDEEVDSFASKTNFSVKNIGDINAYLDISLIINNLPPELNSEDFRWVLYKENVRISEGNFLNVGNKLTMISEDQLVPDSTTAVNYSIAIYIRDNGGNQNAMMNKTLNAKINIDAYAKKLIDFAYTQNPILSNTINGSTIHNLKLYGDSVLGENLFNIGSITSNKYYDSNGALSNDSTLFLSDYISVEEGVGYRFTGSNSSTSNPILRVNYFNENKVWISQNRYVITDTSISNTITIPTGAKYVRFSFLTSSKESMRMTNVQSIDNELEISSVGEKTKNLFNINTDSSLISHINAISEIEDDKLIVIPEGDNLLVRTLYPIYLEKNTDYTFSCDMEMINPEDFSGVSSIFIRMPNNGNVVASKHIINTTTTSNFDANQKVSLTFNSGDNEVLYVWFYFSSTGSGVYGDSYAIYENIQLEKGTTKTDYEPYDKYKIPITVSGNLIYHNQLPRTSPVSVTYNEKNNTYKIKGTMTSSGDAYLLSAGTSIGKLKKGETVTYAIKRISGTNSANLRITNGFVDSSGTVDWQKFAQISATDTESVVSYTVTKDVDMKYMRFFLNPGDYDIEVQVQILKGAYTKDTLPNYEPYQAPQTYNIYLEEPLRKVGNYSDYIDFENRTVVRNVKEAILDGTGTYTNADNSLTNTYRVSKVFSDTNSYNPVISNKLTPITYGTSSNDTENIQFSGTSAYIRINKARLSTIDVTGVKEFFASNPVTFYYATKNTYTLPEEENIELPQIKTLKGNTIITVDTAVKPAMEGSY